MQVKDIMSKTVYTCGLDSTLESAALTMWNNDCGCVPIVNEQNIPVAMVTDRDIAIGAALQHKPLWEIRVSDITQEHPLYCCKRSDDLSTAMELMSRKGVRRLPVLHANGKLAGMISMGDILAYSESKETAELPVSKTLSMLKAVTGHHTELQVA